MAMKPRINDAQLREQRQREYNASQTLAARYPQVQELLLELRFTEGDEVPLLSPYRQIFTGEMQAFFELRCPSRSCAGGGFDLGRAVDDAARGRARSEGGRLFCRGVNTEGAGRGESCRVQLSYGIEVVPLTPR
ncbi:hypothetical protein SAMN04488038_11189 [Solimonas aquatica]|uniref:Uncharacterized protein n=1 Tax=Solimonas aquatica TaxID=489703 RepID=A0A1H9JBD3_9GAMM|nr:hypothetical protein [Solimonas aquatica]SEQ84083.1 hypothetical protein SAMN04488038_11189 [Solimonas aquatica]